MALKLAEIYGIKETKASNGFIQKFKSRHNITCKLINGESGLIKDDVIESFKENYERKLKEYDKQDVFNCDETEFFFKCRPTKTICHRDEKQISGKFSKERITILFCVSLSGEKLEPLIIGKFKTPRGFVNLDFSQLGIEYEHSSKAWMTLGIFERWLSNLNLRMKMAGRKILLTLDNAPVHPFDAEHTNVELLYFPPGFTSKIQPLDQGIIKSFKSLYKKKLNIKINNELGLNSSETYFDTLKRFKIFDSLKLILESWKEVTIETIKNCYKKSIENAFLDVEINEADEIQNIDDYEAPAYANFEDEEIFLEEAQEEIYRSKITNKEEGHEMHKSDYEEETKNYKLEPTHFEVMEHVSALETYFIIHCPEHIDEIYNLKNILLRSKTKRHPDIFDYIKRSSNK
ncbi:Tigger transposable element-derived protein 6 [Dictyocoela muelleri]|nr:Tigger transposable element-derived protein 6 [Dictyocoela muelleri]